MDEGRIGGEVYLDEVEGYVLFSSLLSLPLLAHHRLTDAVMLEKCFVDPSDAESALTISGFYYVSLRRSDGHIEGLYYDPSSTPFQHLTLDPEGRKCFPAYQFT